MASDATILDAAPVTPAHKFAWRALRGFVYGSPESSPESRVPTRAAHREQENRHHHPLAASPPRSSPSSKKRVSMPATITTVAAPLPLLLSPQQKKRKRESLQVPVLSPTKSILRTPGAAPTPRAKSLRDVNVTFKSVSPEARVEGLVVPQLGVRSSTVPGKSMPVAVGNMEDLEKQVDELWEEMERSLVEKEESEKSQSQSPPLAEAKQGRLEVGKRRAKATAQGEVKKDVAVEVSQGKAAGKPMQVDHEDYARRTEREVKRLLRQHKKLRDYAQRADEQNVALQAMVANLQKENARLRVRLEQAEAKTDSSVQTKQKESSKRVPSNKQEQQQQADTNVTAQPSTMDHNQMREYRREEISSKDHNSFERSLRGRLANFSIHEDDAPAYKQRKTTENPQSKSTNQERLSQKQRSTTTSALPPSNPDPDKIPSRNPEPLAKRSSNSLGATEDLSTSTTAQSRAGTQPSPFSLTTLAARLEPTPGPAPRAQPQPTSSLLTTTNHAPPLPPPAPTGLNMSPTRIAAARARLQARRLASGSGSTGGGRAGDAAASSAGSGAGRETAAELDAHGHGHGAAGGGDGHQTSLLLREALAKEDAGFVVGGGRGVGGVCAGRGGSGGGSAQTRQGPVHGMAALSNSLVDESSVDWAQI